MAIVAVTAELIVGIVFDSELEGTCLQLARQDVRLTVSEFRQVLQHAAGADERRRVRAAAALRRLQQSARAEWALARREDLAVHAWISDQLFFHVLGFEVAPSVDASDFEGASIVHDLNQRGLREKLGAPVDFVVETGTAEHIFHLPNYLANVGDCLAVDGHVLHVVPAHGYLDHGFYQFSPTLFLDYYQANSFDLLAMRLLETATEDWSRYVTREYAAGEFDRRDRYRFAERYVMLSVHARKRSDSTVGVIPQQRVYRERMAWTSPVRSVADCYALGRLAGPFLKKEGKCWLARLPAAAGAGDEPGRPRNSRLLLVENDRVLGPAHALHEDIRHLGAGRYSHWGTDLLFSSSDGLDPNRQDRVYSLYLESDPPTPSLSGAGNT